MVALMSYPCTALEDIPTKQDLFVYPNPSAGSFHVEGLSLVSQLEINDVRGSRVNFSLTGNNELTLTDAPDGIYFFRYVDPNGIHVIKLIKQ
jgi:hypothetical protein